MTIWSLVRMVSTAELQRTNNNHHHHHHHNNNNNNNNNNNDNNNNNKDFYSAISVGSWRFTTEYFKQKIL